MGRPYPTSAAHAGPIDANRLDFVNSNLSAQIDDICNYVFLAQRYKHVLT